MEGDKFMVGDPPSSPSLGKTLIHYYKFVYQFLHMILVSAHKTWNLFTSVNS